MTEELLPRPMVLEEFTPLVGKAIRVDCAPKSVDITLMEATALADRGAAPRPPFILIFHSDPKVRLVSGTYALRSGSFGPALVYLEDVVPPMNALPGHYYQAVFN
ncbi:DUF6916 family protein [Sphingomonas sp. MS122]|uniref:DUF6916 family protein n=1 Tax=Sphingomonas sp. MS122 TaxID=3412683 RepID=UPI003C2BD572